MLDQNGAFSLRRRLYAAICAEQIDGKVLKELLPNGQPLLFEKQMWDYKEMVPTPYNGRPTAEQKQTYDAKLAEIVKDVAAFYNSYGGYLVVGVRDNPREVVGFNQQFDCDDLIRRIKAVTKHEIDCAFAIHDVKIGDDKKSLGLLFIPQRPDSVSPAQFIKDAPAAANGKKAYLARDIYLRQGDECLPARSSEDFTFLCSQGRRKFKAAEVVSLGKPLSNNLRERDPGFIKFIGRDEYLHKLWEWLLDPFSPGKLLAGVGGIGKTTIAREFAEQLIRSSPFGFERMIWFSAKKRYYTASIGKYTPTLRVDFSDTQSLLRSLLLELGCPENMIEPDWSISELIAEVIESLKIIPSFVIIDDVDSLEPAVQQDVFHTMLQVMTRAINTAGISSRALLTARLDLGAAPSQVIRVSGLEPIEFSDYVQMTAKDMGLHWSLKAQSPQMKEFHKASSGSPTFAASILRLVTLGATLAGALSRWRKTDGDEVREFAFEKELNNLNDSQVRTLYAMCILGDSSQLELKQVTQSSTTLLMDDLGELRKYHLISTAGETPQGGPRLTVPNWIRLMRDLIKSKVQDPRKIEVACTNARKESPDLEGEVGRWIYRVVALWRSNSVGDALEVAQQAAKKFPDHPDVRCLLGRAYLKVVPADARHADAAFRKAHELKCDRVELIQLWIEAKKKLKDWIGILEITSAPRETIGADNVLIRSEAFENLSEQAGRLKDYSTATRYLLSAIDEIEELLDKPSAVARRLELISMRGLLYQNYVLMLDKRAANAFDYLDVWKASVRAFRRANISNAMLQHGIERLVDWWEAVEKLPPNKNTFDIVKNQIHILSGIADSLGKRVLPDLNFINYMKNTNSALAQRANIYGCKIK